jgi:hypothetical protein
MIRYIPTEILTSHCPDGLDKSYVEGWGIVWAAIERILCGSRCLPLSSSSSTITITTITTTPTVVTIQREIDQMMVMDNNNSAGCRLLPQQKFDHFVGQGGQIEFALDALLDVTCHLTVDRHNFVVDDEKKKKMATLPTITCLDTAFDIARLKCFAIDLTSHGADDDSALLPNGPYRHNFTVHSARRT